MVFQIRRGFNSYRVLVAGQCLKAAIKKEELNNIFGFAEVALKPNQNLIELTGATCLPDRFKLPKITVLVSNFEIAGLENLGDRVTDFSGVTTLDGLERSGTLQGVGVRSKDGLPSLLRISRVARTCTHAFS